MFSMRTRYIAVKAAIRYKKDGILAKSVFFDSNNLRLFACLFNCNCYCNSSTNHGVVTHTYETHHLCALVSFEGGLQSGMLFEKSYYIKLRELLNHKIICAEHIVCVFPENIITRFDVSVNDVSEEFAERLQPKYCHHS